MKILRKIEANLPEETRNKIRNLLRKMIY
jgi:hypothetical protein